MCDAAQHGPARRGADWNGGPATPIVAVMPETPDLKALAEHYLDLWEEQFAAAAADPALAAAMAAWLGPWRAMAGGAMPGGAAPGGGTPSGGEAVRKTHGADKDTGRSRGTAAGAAAEAAAGPAAGAAAAAAAAGGGGRGVHGLVERLERIERRLDALERERAGKGGGAGARARRGRTKGAG